MSARYDALGRRVEATRADGSVERYVYFPGSFLVLAVLDGSNAVKEIYTRGPDLSGSLDGAGGIGGILAVTDSASVVRYYHADIMGNVIALTDASGSIAATFRYTPFGQLSARTGSVLPRYLFSSKEFDRAANLYYYGYRYYAPRMGRWMTRDFLNEYDDNNLYRVCRNAMYMYFDAVGLATENCSYWFNGKQSVLGPGGRSGTIWGNGIPPVYHAKCHGEESRNVEKCGKNRVVREKNEGSANQCCEHVERYKIIRINIERTGQNAGRHQYNADVYFKWGKIAFSERPCGTYVDDAQDVYPYDFSECTPDGFFEKRARRTEFRLSF